MWINLSTANCSYIRISDSPRECIPVYIRPTYLSKVWNKVWQNISWIRALRPTATVFHSLYQPPHFFCEYDIYQQAGLCWRITHFVKKVFLHQYVPACWSFGMATASTQSSMKSVSQCFLWNEWFLSTQNPYVPPPRRRSTTGGHVAVGDTRIGT